MPYFLVTHTSLVEADDEAGAAAKAYEKISESDRLSFDVRTDEKNVTRVTIPTGKGEPRSLPEGSDISTPLVETTVKPPDEDHNETDNTIARQLRRSPLPPNLIYSGGIIAVAALFVFTHFWV